MSSAALADLEALLSARRLDHTLTSRLSPPAEDGPAGKAATGLSALDAPLAGGLPRGQISEIVGPRSSGRQTMLVSWLAAATARGELSALVDPLDMFDPPSAAARGLDLSRLLWVRGRPLGPDRVSLPREAGDLAAQVDRAVKALNLILQAGGFGLVALDLGEVPQPVIGRLPFTTWRRLHRVIEGGETACVVVAGAPLARSAAGMTLALQAVGRAQSAAATSESAPAARVGGGHANQDASRGAATRGGGAPRALETQMARLALLPVPAISGHVVYGRGMRSVAVSCQP
jgi:hypothetical protein